MQILITILVTFFAGMGAGLGTGFAGMSAAAVISPMRSLSSAWIRIWLWVSPCLRMSSPVRSPPILMRRIKILISKTV